MNMLSTKYGCKMLTRINHFHGALKAQKSNLHDFLCKIGSDMEKNQKESAPHFINTNELQGKSEDN